MIAYVDVDGVLIVPDIKSIGISSVFVRDLVEPIHLSGTPTAKESWRNMPLRLAPDAGPALQLISESFDEVRFLTAHPKWSVDWIMEQLELRFPRQYVDWKRVNPGNKALSVSTDEEFVWFEDDLKQPIEDTLKERGCYDCYVYVDPIDGLSLSHVECALSVRQMA